MFRQLMHSNQAEEEEDEKIGQKEKKKSKNQEAKGAKSVLESWLSHEHNNSRTSLGSGDSRLSGLRSAGLVIETSPFQSNPCRSGGRISVSTVNFLC